MSDELQPHETVLRGTLLRHGCRVVGDMVCSRIEWLRTQRLERIGEGLYRNPADGRVWELTFEKDGSPTLRVRGASVHIAGTGGSL